MRAHARLHSSRVFEAIMPTRLEQPKKAMRQRAMSSLARGMVQVRPTLEYTWHHTWRLSTSSDSQLQHSSSFLAGQRVCCRGLHRGGLAVRAVTELVKVTWCWASGHAPPPAAGTIEFNRCIRAKRYMHVWCKYPADPRSCLRPQICEKGAIRTLAVKSTSLEVMVVPRDTIFLNWRSVATA